LRGFGSCERQVRRRDLLVATGRTPNTKGIGLDQVGIEFNGHGYIKVNDWLETTAANVGAMGDCAGSPQFTHAAYNGFGRGAARVMNISRDSPAERLSASLLPSEIVRIKPCKL
jgi:pyruvate/2-oxoglutarate dehydrogenase complex dihydrolipoamide dehydrogenase (E3) component